MSPPTRSLEQSMKVSRDRHAVLASLASLRLYPHTLSTIFDFTLHHDVKKHIEATQLNWCNAGSIPTMTATSTGAIDDNKWNYMITNFWNCQFEKSLPKRGMKALVDPELMGHA